jgi:hypothetical protein
MSTSQAKPILPEGTKPYDWRRMEQLLNFYPVDNVLDMIEEADKIAQAAGKVVHRRRSDISDGVTDFVAGVAAYNHQLKAITDGAFVGAALSSAMNKNQSVVGEYVPLNSEDIAKEGVAEANKFRKAFGDKFLPPSSEEFAANFKKYTKKK